MNSHLYIINDSAYDLSGYGSNVHHILRADPFELAPSWATCIRKNEYLGFCWCDSDVLRFACICPDDEAEALYNGKPYDERSAFGDVVATRLVNNDQG